MASKIQIPKSIAKVASSVAALVRAHYPNISCIDDVDIQLQLKWETTCDHELFYQDIDRFIGDIYTEKCLTTESGW